MKYVSVYDLSAVLNEWKGDIQKFLKISAPLISKARIMGTSASGYTVLGYELEGMLAHLRASVSTFDDRQEEALRALSRPSWKDVKAGLA